MSTAPAEDAAHVVARVAELVVEVAIAPGNRHPEGMAQHFLTRPAVDAGCLLVEIDDPA